MPGKIGQHIHLGREVRKAADGSEKMMGDEFSVKGAPTLDIKFIGTAPFSKVTLIKDNVEIPLEYLQT